MNKGNLTWTSVLIQLEAMKPKKPEMVTKLFDAGV